MSADDHAEPFEVESDRLAEEVRAIDRVERCPCGSKDLEIIGT